MNKRQQRIAASERGHYAADWPPQQLAAHANAELAELLCCLAENHAPGHVARGCASVLIALYWLAERCGGDLEASWRSASQRHAGMFAAVEHARGGGVRVTYSGSDILAAMGALVRCALERSALDYEAQWHRALVGHAGHVAAAIGALALRRDILLMDEVENELSLRKENRDARRCH